MKATVDDTDKRLLYELYQDARQPDSALARKLRRSKEGIRYRIKKLEEKGVVKNYLTWINPCKLGYRGYKIYLKMTGNEKQIKEFHDELKQRTDLFWYAVANGSWDVGMTFFAKSDEEFFDRKSQLLSRYNELILQKSIGIVLSVHMYPMKSLYSQPGECFSVYGKIENNDIDDLDRKVLSELFHDSRIKLVELAKKTGTTVDIARGRIKKLEKNNILARYGITMDFQKLGLEFHKLFLYFSSFSKEDRKRLFEFASHDPNATCIVTLIAPWDVEYCFLAENNRQYNEVVKKLKAEFPSLRNVEPAIISEEYLFPARGTIAKL